MIAAARELSIHAYGGAYRADCLCLFEENTADFFAPGERAEYAAFLDSAADSYFIMQVPVEGTIAAGGYDMTAQPGSGALAWGIVARSPRNWPRIASFASSASPSRGCAVGACARKSAEPRLSSNAMSSEKRLLFQMGSRQVSI